MLKNRSQYVHILYIAIESAFLFRIFSQCGHMRSSLFVFGRVYLPVSMFILSTLIRIFVIWDLYLVTIVHYSQIHYSNNTLYLYIMAKICARMSRIFFVNFEKENVLKIS